MLHSLSQAQVPAASLVLLPLTDSRLYEEVWPSLTMLGGLTIRRPFPGAEQRLGFGWSGRVPLAEGLLAARVEFHEIAIDSLLRIRRLECPGRADYIFSSSVFRHPL